VTCPKKTIRNQVVKVAIGNTTSIIARKRRSIRESEIEMIGIDDTVESTIIVGMNASLIATALVIMKGKTLLRSGDTAKSATAERIVDVVPVLIIKAQEMAADTTIATETGKSHDDAAQVLAVTAREATVVIQKSITENLDGEVTATAEAMESADDLVQRVRRVEVAAIAATTSRASQMESTRRNFPMWPRQRDLLLNWRIRSVDEMGGKCN